MILRNVARRDTMFLILNTIFIANYLDNGGVFFPQVYGWLHLCPLYTPKSYVVFYNLRVNHEYILLSIECTVNRCDILLQRIRLRNMCVSVDIKDNVTELLFIDVKSFAVKDMMQFLNFRFFATGAGFTITHYYW